jgi:hypothetical protein
VTIAALPHNKAAPQSKQIREMMNASAVNHKTFMNVGYVRENVGHDKFHNEIFWSNSLDDRMYEV